MDKGVELVEQEEDDDDGRGGMVDRVYRIEQQPQARADYAHPEYHLGAEGSIEAWHLAQDLTQHVDGAEATQRWPLRGHISPCGDRDWCG